ncbi:MAG: NADH-quinone oxidoreductase subunit N [Candidatus Omnitrophica bacterium]|nr:NADH-quinone oxidoreductase subunit N [Candidatus Omnitrophota bacterium]
MNALLLESLNAWWPELLLSAGALLAAVAGAMTKRAQPAMAIAWLAVLGAAAALRGAPTDQAGGLFFGVIVCDALACAIRWLVVGMLALVLLMIAGSREVEGWLRGEYVSLLLLVGVGLMLMAEASHLLVAYVGMELVSLSSYALVGLLDDARSAEASLKYLLFGALASGLMLFGISLLFGLTGTLDFAQLLAACRALSAGAFGALLMASALLLAGLAFKISMVPFHFWTPDAYEGAPIPVAAMLSVGPKAAGMAMLLRLVIALTPAWDALQPLLVVLTVATMTLGNLVALAQSNIKRLLAYSTIAQVGYVLIGFVVNSQVGLVALLVYLAAYLFMNLGIFACAIAVVNATGSESLDAFRGLAARAPALALWCAVFLLSLAGIPPLLGFLGKFLIFGSAIAADQLWLALAGILNSAVALYYYVNLIRLMYLVEPQSASPIRPAWPLRVAVGVCGAGTLLLGIFPSALIGWARGSAFVNLL